MINLIRTDLKRVLKDRLFLVMCILAGVFAVITPLLYILLLGEETDEMMTAMVGELTTARALFFDAFSLGNNFGLIGPVLLAIVLCKDFSYGTVRNKIISGHSRTSIFLSMYIVCSAVLFVVVFLQALVSLAVGLIKFDLGIKAEDIGYVLGSLGLELLLYLAVSAFVCWLCASMKNVGLVIVLYVAVLMALTMIGSILSIIIAVLEYEKTAETAVSIMKFFQNINIFNYGLLIGKGDSYETKQLLYYALTPVIAGVSLLGLGIIKFNKKDLK